jgi:hypothetical protein
MLNPFMFKDNLILHLTSQSMKMDTKVWATGEDNSFKVSRGMDAANRLYTTEKMTRYEVETLAIDHIINGYSVKTNFLFQGGIDGIVQERAKAFKSANPTWVQAVDSDAAICDRGNSDTTEVKIITDGLTDIGFLPSGDN